MVVFAFPESTFLFLGFAYDEQGLFAEWSERGPALAELGSRGFHAIAESELRIAVGTNIPMRLPHRRNNHQGKMTRTCKGWTNGSYFGDTATEEDKRT